LPKITAAPVGWATWSGSAFDGLRDALNNGVIGEGIEHGGGLFGSIAADGTVRVEEAGLNPSGTRASATATRIDWEEIERRAEDLVFAGTGWEICGHWHSHEVHQEDLQPSAADIASWSNAARSLGKPHLCAIVAPSDHIVTEFPGGERHVTGNQWSPIRLKCWLVPGDGSVVWPARLGIERSTREPHALMPRLD
jgi:hypothetical protein